MIRRDNFSPLNSAKQVFFEFTKKVNLTEMLMNKSISCLCYSKHIETKFCNNAFVINNTLKRKLKDALKVKILFILKKN